MRVLVVEDEPDLQRGLAMALREEGYAVDVAADGEAGLSKANAWDYDAIVLDWMLPGLSGIDLLRELRRVKRTPVLMLTARDAVGDRVHGLDAGADDYLVKPFQLVELQARIRSLIRRGAGNPTPMIEIGNVVIDTAKRLVTVAEEPVTLAAREYALVELLALHRQKVVTRTMIYDHLFDENHDSLSNLVDVYISKIRGKLGKGFVTTRRGEGYIVED